MGETRKDERSGDSVEGESSNSDDNVHRHVDEAEAGEAEAEAEEAEAAEVEEAETSKVALRGVYAHLGKYKSGNRGGDSKSKTLTYAGPKGRGGNGGGSGGMSLHNNPSRKSCRSCKRVTCRCDAASSSAAGMLIVRVVPVLLD